MRNLISFVKSDLAALEGQRGILAFCWRYWADPSFATLCRWRTACHFQGGGQVGRVLAKFLWRRNIRASSCFLSPKAELGKAIVLPHATAIVVGEGVRIGNGVVIYQGVTLGLKSSGADGYPMIEDRARLFAGACVLGPVTVGADAVVAANAVVTRNVTPRSVVAGVPARPLKQPANSAS